MPTKKNDVDPASTPRTRTPAPEIPTTGMDHLRAVDETAMRLWKVKGPKEPGGEITAVFLAESSTVVLLHQMPSGKFVTFGKVDLVAPTKAATPDGDGE